ncbi:hypothetical protein [Luteolibacter sp. LG18]|uniref:hypothetical protein n=1 Tax=Luteolibacter sp. LG18 TaxID=2819286 RepID=UPI002B30FCF5|nr:hypothetical protein llg_07040 [Luteolibacter sp. LG18]BCU79667.1 hypothetical protein llg_43820 [Luteolibacter sp. LG18]
MARMTCGEFACKVVDWIWASVEAIATVVAAIWAYRAFKAQSRQLDLQRLDRQNEGLAKSPRFRATGLVQSPDLRGVPVGNVVGCPEKTPGHPTLDALPHLGHHLIICNLRKDIEVSQLEIRIDGDAQFRGMQNRDLLFTVDPMDTPNSDYQFFVIRYPWGLGTTGETVRLRVQFVTATGFEQSHIYETRIRERHFHRVNPPFMAEADEEEEDRQWWK